MLSWLDTDEGARYLGEFALVSEESPIAASGLYFDQLHYDENASSHIALGWGWKSAVEGGVTMSERELDAIGLNRSKIHTDIMFGSADLTVIANRSRDGEVHLLDRGRWNALFR